MTDPADWAATPSPNGNEVGSEDLFRARPDRAHHRVLELAGEYDIASDDLRAALDDKLPGPPGLLVIDLTHVTFIDAHCTGMLLNAASKRQVVLVGATGIVARVLDLLDPAQQPPRHRARPGQAATKLN